MNLYLPFPNPLTGSIKSAFFSFIMRFPAAVTEFFVIVATSETAKDTINTHIRKYRFCLCNRTLSCVQLIHRNLNRNIFVLNRNIFVLNRNIACGCCLSS